jgi:hypothetical protein
MIRTSTLAALPLVAALATSVVAEGPLDLEALFAAGTPPEPEAVHAPPTWEAPVVTRVARYAPLGPGHPAIDLWRVEVEVARPDGKPFGSPRARPEGSVWPSYAPDLLVLEGGMGSSMAYPDQPGRVSVFVPALVEPSGASFAEIGALLDQTSDEERPRSGRVDLTRYPIHAWSSEGMEPAKTRPSQQAVLLYGDRMIDGFHGGGSIQGQESRHRFGGGDLVQVWDGERRLDALHIEGTPPPGGATWILRARDGSLLGTVSVAAGAESWPPGVLRLPEPDFQDSVHVQILPHAGVTGLVAPARKVRGPFLDGAAASALYGLGLDGLVSAGYLPAPSGD